MSGNRSLRSAQVQQKTRLNATNARSTLGNPASDHHFVEAICRYVSQAVKASGISGVHVGLSVRGRNFLVHDGVPCTSKSCRKCICAAFPISDLAKPLLAIAGLRFAEAGTLQMDAPLTTYFPELDGYGKDLACVHLLTHTTGYKGTLSREVLMPGWTTSELLQYLRAAPQLFVPGTVVNYDHSAIGLICEMLCRASGKTCFALVDEVMRDLAGMTGAARSKDRFTSTASMNARLGVSSGLGLAWTRGIHIDEVLALCHALTADPDSGRAEKPKISNETRKALFDPMVSLPRPIFGASKDWLPSGFSLGLAMFCRGLIGYDGSLGNRAIGFRMHTQHQISVVLGVENGGQTYRRRLLPGILACLNFPLRGPDPVIHSEFDLQEIQGVYVGNDDTLINVARSGSELRIEICQKGATRVLGRGDLGRDGSLTFRSQIAIEEPVFFRDPFTSLPCLMLGLCTFKWANRG
jgi:hypothetical protein